MSEETDQGAEYAGFLNEQLTREYDRRDLVNSRAATAITSGTALVTLSTGVYALLLGKDFKLDGPALGCMAVALFAFLFSAGCAVVAGLNRTYDAVDEDTMRSLLSSERWKDHPVDARWQTANFAIMSIVTLRIGTNFKYQALTLAGIAQVVAIFALVVSAVLILG